MLTKGIITRANIRLILSLASKISIGLGLIIHWGIFILRGPMLILLAKESINSHFSKHELWAYM